MSVFDINEIIRTLNKNRKPINFYVDIDNPKYSNFDPKKNAGIYVFWYHNIDKKVEKLNRDLVITGPKNSVQNVEWDWNMDNEFLCLYIGEATDFQKRISKHLLLKTDKLKNINGGQLRSGFDYLYSYNEP
jgi:hypothetical protein